MTRRQVPPVSTRTTSLRSNGCEEQPARRKRTITRSIVGVSLVVVIAGIIGAALYSASHSRSLPRPRPPTSP